MSGTTDDDLIDIISVRLTNEVLVFLCAICNAFDGRMALNGVDIGDHAVGEQGIGMCRMLMSKSMLESVRLFNNGLVGETIQHVVDIHTSAVPVSSSG